MLQFFRINDPYRLIFIFLILVIVRVGWVIFGLPFSVPELKFLLIGKHLGDGFIMYKELYDHTGPLAAMVYKYIDIVFGQNRWVHMVFSTFLITLQAGLFNNILLRNKAYDENTYVPAFLYMILFCGTIDFFALTPQLMALTFILLALNQVFRRIDNVVTDELFLHSGLYLGLATFFYLPAVIYLVLFLLSLILFSSAVLRRLLIFLYGAIVVGLVIVAYFFWFDAAGNFILSFFKAGALKPATPLIGYMELISAAYFLIPVSLLSLSVIFTQRLTTFQQKMQQVMIMLLLGGIVIIFLAKDLSTNELVLFIPSVAFFLTYYLLRLKRKIWKFTLPYAIIIGLIAYPFFWMENHLDSGLIADEEVTDIEGEKLMGIGVPISYYLNNELSGPFLEDYISEQELKGLDYLDGASDVYQVIIHSSPTLVVDRKNVMPRILYRFPQLKELYLEEGNGIYRKVAD